MDFFEYATVASMFVDDTTLWVPMLVGGLCFLIVFIFQAVGLYTIAVRAGYKNRWMAFLPFFNTYYIGVCGQKNRCFGSLDTRKLALATAILEAALFAAYVVYYVACAAVQDYLVVVDSYEVYGITYFTYGIKNIPVSLAWAGWCYEFLYDCILCWVELVFLFMQVMVLSAFFQTYAARRYFLYTITSILFPIQGILIFAIRNNRGMNYREYLRREQERQYRMYREYNRQNFEQNPYNQNPYSRTYNDPYRNGGYGGNNGDAPYGNREGNPSAPEDPFSEFDPTDKNDPFSH